MRRKKVVSQLCSMNEHDCCEPRWTEDDESGLPTVSCRCVCNCHDPNALAKAERFKNAAVADFSSLISNREKQ